jgi:hypothetical protein
LTAPLSPARAYSARAYYLRSAATEDGFEGDGAEGLNDDGLVASAEACYKAWKGHFEADA